MRTLFLRSLLIWLIFMPAAAVGLIVMLATGWVESPVPWWIGMGVWWPVLYVLVQIEGQPTPLGRWLTKVIGPLMP